MRRHKQDASRKKYVSSSELNERPVMPLKILYPDHLEIIGKGLVLLSSPPTSKPTADLSVGGLTEEIALLSKGHAIIAKETKSTDPAIIESTTSEYYASAKRLLIDRGVKFVLELRGRKEPGIEIKFYHGFVPDEMVELARTAFAIGFEVKVTARSSADRNGYSSDGELKVLVLEFGPAERTFQRDSVIASVADTVGLINGKLGQSERDEGPGDALD